MSFKTHLVIVASLIAFVLIGWSFMISQTPPPPPPKSPYSVTVAHASWGLNCLSKESGPAPSATPHFQQEQKSDPLREDNVLEAVGKICNGQIACEIPLQANALGGDPAPLCSNKILEVEYRCYSFDRPWQAKSTNGAMGLVLNCSDKFPANAQ